MDRWRCAADEATCAAWPLPPACPLLRPRCRRLLPSWLHRHGQQSNRWSGVNGGDVDGCQRCQHLVARVPEWGDALRLMGDSGLEEIAHEAGVAEPSCARLGADEMAHAGQRIVTARVLA